MNESKKIGVTEVVLRDAHQSLLATRFRYHDMEAALKDLDDVGFWSVESWGGQSLIHASDIWVKTHGKGLEKLNP